MPASYSFSWALSVVESLKRKYTRATETVERILDIDDRILANYLAKGDPVFAQLRAIIHTVDSWQRHGGWSGNTPTDVYWLRLQMLQKGYDRPVGRLDKLKNWAKLEEQA